MSSEYDLVVIGAGPAGYVGAIRAAQLGMRTAVVENERVGGVCVNWGCIPTKAILHCAEVYDLARARAGRADCGVRSDALAFDFGAVIDKSRRAAERLARGIEGLFRNNRIDLIPGRGRLADGQTVVVTSAGGDASERRIQARRILLATGARPKALPGITVDGKRILTSREALALREIPGSVLIVGAGAVGLEFASFYAGYGARVTVVEMELQIVPGTDEDVANEMKKALERRGITILTGTICRDIEISETGVKVVAVPSTKGGTGILPVNAERLDACPTSHGQDAHATSVEAEKMLLAVGSTPNSENLGLESLGITVEKGFVRIGPGFRTACETVWAVGDLIGPPLLAHAASAEAIAAVEAMAGLGSGTVNYQTIPACIYSQPEMATVGWTEKQAAEKRSNVGVVKTPFVANGKAIAVGQTDGFVKLVFDKDSREILGCHMVGHGVTELINLLGLAMSAKLTVAQVAHTVYAHPTRGELIGEAALAALGQTVIP
jgi:dihydrolipoamide dehydrogenase